MWAKNTEHTHAYTCAIGDFRQRASSCRGRRVSVLPTTACLVMGLHVDVTTTTQQAGSYRSPVAVRSAQPHTAQSLLRVFSLPE